MGDVQLANTYSPEVHEMHKFKEMHEVNLSMED